MNLFNVISLAGGLALFLYGMRIMGDGLKYGASSSFKKAVEKVTNRPVIGFLMGLAITAVIQSSTATIVITSGLVGAGILSLHQSLGVILGANVGTTVTGQIIRLLDLKADASSWLNFFKPSTLAPIASVLGILLIMAFHFRNSETYGQISIGFGILFTGLLNMTAAVSPLSQSPAFSQLFVNLSHNPILGFLAGAAAAFLIQSSSATVGILQALSFTGALSFGSIYSIIIGIYLGDCVTTAIVCSIGSKPDAKRTGIVHILFNLSEIVMVAIAVTLLHRLGLLDRIWSLPITSGGIANTHTIFKLSTAILMLPFCGLLEKASRVIVKGDLSQGEGIKKYLETLDPKFYSTPTLALSSVHQSVLAMANLACEGASVALEQLTEYDAAKIKLLQENEGEIDTLADAAENYLIHLSPHAETDDTNDQLNYYLRCLSEFERIGDHAINLTDNAAEIAKSSVQFSPIAQQELVVLQEAVLQIMEYANKAFADLDLESARHIEPLEEVIDDLVDTLRGNHTHRLREGLCNVDAGINFLNILTNVERIADQCSNVGVYTIALTDFEIGKTHHDYLRYLHKGGDELFNQEYRDVHEAFFSKLEAIEP